VKPDQHECDGDEGQRGEVAGIDGAQRRVPGVRGGSKVEMTAR
jgi:hypothetical protein